MLSAGRLFSESFEREVVPRIGSLTIKCHCLSHVFFAIPSLLVALTNAIPRIRVFRAAIGLDGETQILSNCPPPLSVDVTEIGGGIQQVAVATGRFKPIDGRFHILLHSDAVFKNCSDIVQHNAFNRLPCFIFP